MSPGASGPSRHVTVTAGGGVTTITLDSAPVNALSRAVIQELAKAIRSRQVASANAVVVRSALPRFFTAGADIKLLPTFDRAGFGAYLADVRGLLDELEALPMPTIAALDGTALGGGLELALACDLRVGSAAAALGMPEVKLGLLPGAGGTQRLPRLIGRARALDLLATGRSVDGEEAFRIGLIDRLASRADDGAEELAALIARSSGEVTRALGRCLEASDGDHPAEGMDTELHEVLDLFVADTAQVQIRAFLDRRGTST